MNLNDNNNEKLIGYSLVIIGLIIVLYAAFNIYQVFTGIKEPYPLFNFEPISIDFAKMAEQPPPPGTELKQDLVSGDILSRPLNYGAYLLLMGFIASVGYKVSRIGAYMLRTIKLKVVQKGEEIKISTE